MMAVVNEGPELLKEVGWFHETYCADLREEKAFSFFKGVSSPN